MELSTVITDCDTIVEFSNTHSGELKIVTADLPKTIFNYKIDVTFCFNDKVYTVQELLDMKDEDFDEVYSSYQYQVGELMDTMSKPLGGLLMPAFDSAVSMMERVVLERRISKIEKALSK